MVDPAFTTEGHLWCLGLFLSKPQLGKQGYRVALDMLARTDGRLFVSTGRLVCQASVPALAEMSGLSALVVRNEQMRLAGMGVIERIGVQWQFLTSWRDSCGAEFEIPPAARLRGPQPTQGRGLR
jgi:hypothetical protein